MPAMVLAFSDPVMQRSSWRATAYTKSDARDHLAEQEEGRLRGEELKFALVELHDQDVVPACAHEVVRYRRARRSADATGRDSQPGDLGRGRHDLRANRRPD
jgi:hypothetical protein